MLVVSIAAFAQFPRYAMGVCEESRWFQDRPKWATDRPRAARHAELAHVCPDSLDVWLFHEALDLFQVPARGEPRVLMKEEPSLAALVLIQLHAEAHVPLRLFDALMEFGHPHVVVPVHVLVQLLEPREERAWW